MHDRPRGDLPPSIVTCEVLDGPYAGHIVPVGVRARFVAIRPRSSSLPLVRYEVVRLGDLPALRWAPGAVVEATLPFVNARIFCTHCGNQTITNGVTGEQRDMLVKIISDQLAVLQDDIAGLRCADCEGPMDAQVLDEV